MFERFQNYIWSSLRQWDLTEMARQSDQFKIPLFTQYDENYFAHVYDWIIENVPDYNKQLGGLTLLEKLMRCAFAKRFGNPEALGSQGGILHEPQYQANPPKKIDLKLVVGEGRRKTEYVVPNTPFEGEELVKRFEDKGFDWKNPHFGYDKGMIYYIGTAKKIREIIKYLEDASGPRPTIDYNADNALKLNASLEDKDKARTSKEKGRIKEKNAGKTSDSAEFEEKSYAKIPLDDEDKKYLESVQKQLEDRDDIPETSRGKYLDQALGLRYGDAFVDSSGNPQNIKPDGTGILMFKDGTTLHNIYVNLPHLVDKMKKHRLERDFLKEPLLSNTMGTQDWQKGRIAAERWREQGTYKPSHGRVGGETKRDNAFLEAMDSDFKKWVRKPTDEPYVKVNKPDDKEFASKLTWRNEDRTAITESPNIADKYPDRDQTSFPSFHDLLMDDVKRALPVIINRIHSDVFSGFRDFLSWVNNEKESLEAKGIAVLTMRLTGFGEEFRKESFRLRKLYTEIGKEIESKFRQSATGTGGEEEETLDNSPTAKDDISSPTSHTIHDFDLDDDEPKKPMSAPEKPGSIDNAEAEKEAERMHRQANIGSTIDVLHPPPAFRRPGTKMGNMKWMLLKPDQKRLEIEKAKASGWDGNS